MIGACGHRIRTGGTSTKCVKCRILAGDCARCHKPHNNVNPRTGRLFTQCATCAARSRVYIKRHMRKVRAKKRAATGQAFPSAQPARHALPHVSQSIYVQHDPIAALYSWGAAIQRTSPVTGSAA